MSQFDNVRYDQATSELVFRMMPRDASLAVTIRKIVLTEVETVAVSYDPYSEEKQDVVVTYNSGCLHNEWLCHRLSLIPICFDAGHIDSFDKDKYEFRLSVECKPNANMDVTSQDIRVYVDGKLSLIHI
jgi:hypothetical protein